MLRGMVLMISLSWCVGTLAKTKVAWVFSDPRLCKTSVCLHGQFKKGTDVVLLSKKEEKICSAKVGESFRAKYQPGEFEASELTGLKGCKINPQHFYLAVLEKTKAKYNLFPAKSILPDELLNLDKALKKDPVFARSWRRDLVRPEGNKDRVPYTVADFKRMPSEGFHFELKNSKLRVLRQKLSDGSNPGIFFVHFRNSWSVASSTFTQGKPLVFTLDKRVFVVTRVSCQMACGYLDNEVYEFNGRKFKLIYNNADFST